MVLVLVIIWLTYYAYKYLNGYLTMNRRGYTRYRYTCMFLYLFSLEAILYTWYPLYGQVLVIMHGTYVLVMYASGSIIGWCNCVCWKDNDMVIDIVIVVVLI